MTGLGQPCVYSFIELCHVQVGHPLALSACRTPVTQGHWATFYSKPSSQLLSPLPPSHWKDTHISVFCYAKNVLNGVLYYMTLQVAFLNQHFPLETLQVALFIDSLFFSMVEQHPMTYCPTVSPSSSEGHLVWRSPKQSCCKHLHVSLQVNVSEFSGSTVGSMVTLSLIF